MPAGKAWSTKQETIAYLLDNAIAYAIDQKQSLEVFQGLVKERWLLMSAANNESIDPVAAAKI